MVPYDTKRCSWVMLHLHFSIIRKSLVMLCSNSKINNPSGYLNHAVYLAVMLKPLGILQRVTKSQKVYMYQVMMYCKTLITSTLLEIGADVFPERG